MTPQQVTLVQSTWKLVLPIAGTAADIFYDTLFELDPTVKPLFPADLAEQKIKLMAMIGRVVASLHELDSIVADVAELGRRHVTYGVEPRHYDTVGKALLATLATGLGAVFDAPVRDAWMAAYDTLAGAMIRAADARAAAG